MLWLKVIQTKDPISILNTIIILMYMFLNTLNNMAQFLVCQTSLVQLIKFKGTKRVDLDYLYDLMRYSLSKEIMPSLNFF